MVKVVPQLELKRKLADIANEVQPDIAFVQNTEDHWPDHVATGDAGKDAVLFAHGLTAKNSSAAHQTIHFEPDFFFDLTPVMSRNLDLI